MNKPSLESKFAHHAEEESTKTEKIKVVTEHTSCSLEKNIRGERNQEKGGNQVDVLIQSGG